MKSILELDVVSDAKRLGRKSLNIRSEIERRGEEGEETNLIWEDKNSMLLLSVLLAFYK